MSDVTILTEAVDLWDPPPEAAVRELHAWLATVVAGVLAEVASSSAPGKLTLQCRADGWPKTLSVEQAFGEPSRRGPWGHALVRHSYDNPRDGGGFQLFGTVRDVEGGVDLALTASGYWGSAVPLAIRDRGRRRVAALARAFACRRS